MKEERILKFSVQSSLQARTDESFDKIPLGKKLPIIIKFITIQIQSANRTDVMRNSPYCETMVYTTV